MLYTSASKTCEHGKTHQFSRERHEAHSKEEEGPLFIYFASCK